MNAARLALMAIVLTLTKVAHADTPDAAPDAGAPDAGVPDPTATDAAPSTTPDAAPALPEVDELRPPSSPAFSLLGISPTEIDRPKTPAAATASVAALIGTSVPSSAAIEVAPFWLYARPTLTTDDMSKLMTRVVSSASVTLATSKPTGMTSTATGPTDLSLGFSTIPFQDHDGNAFAACNKDPPFLDEPKVQDDYFRAAIAACHSDAACETKAEANTAAFMKSLADTVVAAKAAVADAHSKKLEECEKAYWTPHGFVMSMAFATAWRFPDSTWSSGEYLRSALWTSLGVERERITILGLARLQWEPGGYDGPRPDLADFGGRVVVHARSFAASVEGVGRLAISSLYEDGYRLALVGEAKIGDSWFTLSVGKDYDSTKDGSFFALANVSFTAGEPTLPAPK